MPGVWPMVITEDEDGEFAIKNIGSFDVRERSPFDVTIGIRQGCGRPTAKRGHCIPYRCIANRALGIYGPNTVFSAPKAKPSSPGKTTSYG